MKLFRRASMRRLIVLAVAFVALTLLHASPAFSQPTVVVTTADDDGPGSLRQAILDVDDGGTITFNIPGPGSPGCGCGGPATGGGDVGDVIVLATGQLLIDKHVTIIGPTSKGLAISGDQFSRVFLVAPLASLSLSNAVIADGLDADDGLGGGGILSYGELTLSHVLVVGNFTIGEGGGINSEGTALTILDSTIAQNAAVTDGGGLLNCNVTTALLVNVTIVDNISDLDQDGFGSGGGIGQVSSNKITLQNTIVAYNLNGFTNDYDDVFVLAGSVLDPTSHHNLIGVDTGFTVEPGTGISNGVNGNLIGTADNLMDPLLDFSLDYNGSPLYTYQPQQGSPVLDAGDNTAAADAGLTTDQRGFPRVLDSGDADLVQTVDMGAFEARASVEIIDEINISEDNGALVVPFTIGDTTTITSLTAVTQGASTSIVPNNVANLSITGMGASRTLTITPLANTFGTAVVRIRADADPTSDPDGFERFTARLTINIAPVADTPSVTGASTFVNTQTTTGLVISRNAADDTEVSHFQITNITNGLLFQNDGVTPINDGDFITFDDGDAGLKFTPAVGFSGPATFEVQGATDDLGSGLSPAVTATINVVYPSTTTVVSANPEPSDQTQPITVVYSVNSAGPAPTGNVTVTISGGSETCTGTAAAGQCTLMPTVAGVRDITATYAGDAVTAGSSSSPFAHTVDTCTVNPIVTVTADSGAGSLRQAILDACYGSTITFNIAGAGPHTILLTGGELTLTENVTITGSSDGVRLSGNHASRIATVNADVVAALNRLTLMDGEAATGGAISNGGTLTISGSTLSGNVATSGGGGGAILSAGTLTITGSTLSGNVATSSVGGGGALVNVGTATLANSTLSGNSGNVGGAIVTFPASVALTLVHVTITGNTATAEGGGLMMIGPGGLTTIANTIIAGNTAPSSAEVSGPFTQVGNNMVSGDPMLGPLQDNGGPTWTRMPQAGSPALDAGDNATAGVYSLTTDQRGTGFARALDAADAGTTQTVDIGAVEADPTLPLIGDQTINEDGSVPVTINVGDATTAFDAITAVSSDVTLLPNLPANVALTGSGSTRTLTLTPVANLSGSSIVTVTATKTVGGVLQTSETSFTLIVNAVNDPPTLNAIPNPAVIPEDSPQQTVNFSGISAGGGESQTLAVVALSNNTALIPNPTVTYVSANATGSLAYTPVANQSGTATISVTVTDALGAPAVQTFTVTVNAVADTPSITSASTSVNTQTTSGLVVSRNAADGIEVTHVRVTGITGGTLFQSNGTTPIGNGAFITIAEGAAGLRFTPAADSVTTGHVTIQASTSALVGGLGGATVTADIVVNPTASVTSVATSGSPSALGQLVTFTATVTPPVAGAAGTVQFFDGANPIGTPVSLSGGIAAFSTAALAPGLHTITAAYSGNTFATLSVGVLPGGQTVYIPSPPLLAIDIPGSGLLPGGDFALGGWALTPGHPAPPGIDAVHVWAAPVDGGPWQFLGSATLGVPRPDVGIVFGSQYATSGYYLNVSGLAAGAWDLHVFPRSAGNPEFSAAHVVRVVVPGGPPRTIITGADGGGAHVRRFSALDPSLPVAGPLTSFFAFEPPFAGGVRVAEGDVTGDGVPDYIAGAGPGGAPEVRIIDGALGTIRAGFVAFEPEFRGGVFVAAADVNDDGFVDVIAGSGEGRRGELKVFSGRDLTVLRDVFVFDPSFTGGVHVAAGDVNGDGYADLIVGAGAGGTDVMALSATDLSVLWTVTPYPGSSGGAWVAAGDVTGDGFADVITGAGAGGSPQVRVFDGHTGALSLDFLAYESGFTGGVRVAAGDVNGDGRADIMTGPGPGRAPEARVFEAATAALLSNVVAYAPSFDGGVFVGTAAPVNRMVIDLPPSGAIVHGAFQLTGWAFDEHPWNAGLDAIHVWAFPVAGGFPSFAGVGTLRDFRPDVAAFYGGQYARAGFHADIAGLAPGTYDVVVYGHSSVSGTFNIQRVVRITVTP